MDDVQDCNNFLDRTGNMIIIWTDTIIAEAEILQDATFSALDESRAVYQE